MVDSALRHFIDGGYDETSLDDICSSLLVSPRTLQRYFGGKEQLALDWQYTALDRFRAALADRDRHAAGRRVVARVRAVHRGARRAHRAEPRPSTASCVSVPILHTRRLAIIQRVRGPADGGDRGRGSRQPTRPSTCGPGSSAVVLLGASEAAFRPVGPRRRRPVVPRPVGRGARGRPRRVPAPPRLTVAPVREPGPDRRRTCGDIARITGVPHALIMWASCGRPDDDDIPSPTAGTDTDMTEPTAPTTPAPRAPRAPRPPTPPRSCAGRSLASAAELVGRARGARSGRPPPATSPRPLVRRLRRAAAPPPRADRHDGRAGARRPRRPRRARRWTRWPPTTPGSTSCSATSATPSASCRSASAPSVVDRQGDRPGHRPAPRPRRPAEPRGAPADPAGRPVVRRRRARRPAARDDAGGRHRAGAVLAGLAVRPRRRRRARPPSPRSCRPPAAWPGAPAAAPTPAPPSPPSADRPTSVR